MRSSSRTTLRQLWWSPLVCFGAAWTFSLTDVGRELENHALDLCTRFRLGFQPPPDPRLAIVLFEDDTEARLGKPWPVDRQYHAQMTQVLALAGARQVAWDVILDSSREGEGDALLAQIAEAANGAGVPVVSAGVTNAEPTGAVPGREGPTKPLTHVAGDIRRISGDKHGFIPYPQLRAVSLYGFADAHPGSDGIRREIPLVVRVGTEVFPSLSLQIILAHYGVKSDDVRVRLGDALSFPAAGRTIRVPIDQNGNLLINYRYDKIGHATDFPVYGYGALLIGLSQVHLEEKKPEPPPPDMKGRIVLLGQTVTGKADVGPSPLRDLTPLTFVVANVVNNVLADDFARRAPPWAVWLGALLVGCLWIAFVADRSVLILCGSAILSMMAFVSAEVWPWVWGSWWVPAIAPLTGLGALQFITIGRRVWQEQKAKQEIKGMFGSYVSPELVDRMIKSEQRPQLGGHEEEITAYFSDIQGYSTFSEKLPPDRLVKLLNEYLTACTDTVQGEGGTLDKYIGDAVVAIFGAPMALPDHAYRACLAAVRVQAHLDELRAKWDAEGDLWPEGVRKMRSRIGLNSGSAIIGNMGSRTRFSYTMTGDNVNLAARMESGAKSWGAYIMCTEATRAACEKHGGDRVVFRPLARIVVMGRTLAVPVYEIVGLKEEIAPRTRECLGLFAQALDRFYARDWDGAQAGFRRSAELEPLVPGLAPGVKGNPSLIYQGLVEEYRQMKLPDDWDGVHVMQHK